MPDVPVGGSPDTAICALGHLLVAHQPALTAIAQASRPADSFAGRACRRRALRVPELTSSCCRVTQEWTTPVSAAPSSPDKTVLGDEPQLQLRPHCCVQSQPAWERARLQPPLPRRPQTRSAVGFEAQLQLTPCCCAQSQQGRERARLRHPPPRRPQTRRAREARHHQSTSPARPASQHSHRPQYQQPRTHPQACRVPVLRRQAQVPVPHHLPHHRPHRPGLAHNLRHRLATHLRPVPASIQVPSPAALAT